MVGGKGWENNSFLDSLGGNEDEQEEANQSYNEYKDSREAFLERQKQMMKTEAGKNFLQNRAAQDRDRQEIPEGEDGAFFGRGIGDDVGSGGGTRFRNMMSRANAAQQHQQMQQQDFFFEQKFGVPLDGDDFDNDDGATNKE